MKYLILILIICTIGCKPKASSHPQPSHTKATNHDTNSDDIDSIAVFSEENLEMHQEKTKAIKRKKLITAPDDKAQLQDLVINKKLYKAEDYYILDYTYPYLNEDINKGYAVFNTYISETYLNIEATENEIMEDKVIFCDSMQIARCMDKRLIDYKIYNAKNDLVSVVIYKENYYSGMKHSTYMFECLNYEMDTHQFIYYNDFFDLGSEKELLSILNDEIKAAIHSGEMYYDCWEISESDFNAYKNNFVINDETITYYFDDCIICPSYTGTYSIQIPITTVMHLIRNYKDIPMIGN
ncbi:hypothetical protein GCM10009430_43740 [Aquimarina litoralis]|uniref:DUF3298 domain-containing protein n=1 Tax=Aquimarina litoralis TaxID=584605 RepID=A0ABN1J8M1_9FLAO